MINLGDLKLSGLLPESIKNDREIKAMAEALDEELRQITACIGEAVLLPNIDQLPEAVVDSLAWQFHVDFYEPLGLDLDKKRALVKNSLNWHKRKGTKSVLEEMLEILYENKSKIEEWFEYGGRPHFFKVALNNVPITQQAYGYIYRAVNELKNVRSWLESIVVTHDVDHDVYVGHCLYLRSEFSVGWARAHPDLKGVIFAGFALARARRRKIGFNWIGGTA